MTPEYAALRAQLEQLKRAITPTHAGDWTVEQIATLAEAHRSDSELMDETEGDPRQAVIRRLQGRAAQGATAAASSPSRKEEEEK